jgi:hypothetical protein
MPASWRSWSRSEPKAELTVEEKKRLAELKALTDQDDADEDAHNAALDESERIHHAAEMRAFTPRQKAKSGCVVFVTIDGTLGVDAGLIEPPPEEAPPPSKAKAKTGAADEGEEQPQAEPEPRISNALSSDLAVGLTESAAMAVKGNFNLAMCVALAAFAVNSDGLPARLSHRGMGSNGLKLTGSDSFAKNLATFLKMKPQQRESLFAQVVAASLEFGSFSAERHAMTDEDVAALVNAVDPKVMDEMIRKRFDPEHYFEKAPKAIVLNAIADVMGKAEARFSETSAKGEVIDYAMANCAPTKWLPPELRSAHYSGPGAGKKAVKAKSAPKAKTSVKSKAKGKKK